MNYEQSNYFNWLGTLFSDWCDCRNNLWPTTKIMINNSEIPRLAYSDSGDAELGLATLVVQFKHLSPQEMQISRCKLLHTAVPSVRF